MASNLDFEGTYDDGENGRPARRFIVSNSTDLDFFSKWDGNPITIRSGDMYECGHALAVKLTKELTDREIFRLAEKAATPKERERIEMSVIVAATRAPYEEKFLQEIVPGKENPLHARLRKEIRKEEQEKLKNETSDAAAGVTKSGARRGRTKKDKIEDFAGLNDETVRS